MRPSSLAINNKLESCEVFLQKRSTNIAVLWCILLILLGFIRLESMPPLWWDEGWSLNVARNWVEQGHYGQVRIDELRGTGLAASFQVIAPVALSFKLFGAGVWQGRLPGVIFTILTFFLMAYISRRLYNRRVAWATQGVLMLMPVVSLLHPILTGRQVLGEMPLMFYLLAGYALFILAFRGPFLFVLPAALVWGITLITKAQVPPFFYAALVVPLMYALLKRWWRGATLLAVGLLGAYYSSRLLIKLQSLIVGGITGPDDSLSGLLQVTAFVPDLNVRTTTLFVGLTIAAPTLIGLVYAGFTFIRDERAGLVFEDKQLVKLSLFVLAASWYTWYLFVGNLWLRYLFPPVFLSAIFIASFLDQMTGSFDLPHTVRAATRWITHRKLNRQSLGAIFAIFFVSATVPLTILTLVISFTRWYDHSAKLASEYLERYTPPHALIETYESEIMFLTDRRFNYPPDQFHVDLTVRQLIDPTYPIKYDPLLFDPDYLVVGTFARNSNLYDPWIEAGYFVLVRSYDTVDIYQRVR
jgi:hypothetical protein